MDPSDLAREHSEAGRSYPRPTVECEECRGILVLCYGTIRDPYFRHIAKTENCSKRGSGGGGESAIHSFAKTILAEYLNDGGVVKCDGDALPLTLEWKVEGTLGECRYDILGYSGDVPVQGIEVMHTHRTTNVIPRTVTWIEVNANEVIDKLDRSERPKTIYLTNVREDLEEAEVKTPAREEEEVVDPTKCCMCKRELLVKKGRNCRTDICDTCYGDRSVMDGEPCKDCKLDSVTIGCPYCNIIYCAERFDVGMDSWGTCLSCVEEVERKHIIYGYRQCIDCKKHDIHPKAASYVIRCRDCYEDYKLLPKEPKQPNPAYYRACKGCQKLAINRYNDDSVLYCKECLYSRTYDSLKQADGYRECAACKHWACSPVGRKFKKCPKCRKRP